MLANKARETALEIQKICPLGYEENELYPMALRVITVVGGGSGEEDGPDHAGLSGSLASCLTVLWPAMSEQNTGLFLLGAETRKEIL